MKKHEIRLKIVVIGVLFSLLQPQALPPPISINIDLSKQVNIQQGDYSTVNLTI